MRKQRYFEECNDYEVSKPRQCIIDWVMFKTEILERIFFNSFAKYKSGVLCEIMGRVAFDSHYNPYKCDICTDKVETFKKSLEMNYSFLFDRTEELLRYYISVYLVEDLNVYLFKEEWIDDILKSIDVNDLSITLESVIDKTNKYIEEKQKENPDFCKL